MYTIYRFPLKTKKKAFSESFLLKIVYTRAKNKA